MKSIILIMGLVLSLNATCVDGVIIPSAESGRFIDHKDGTVTDNKTGLLWATCNLGQTYESKDGVCSGTTTLVNWPDALNAAISYSPDYQSGWRVPTIKELNSIIERSCSAPALKDELLYDGTIAQLYWSSTHAGASHDKYEFEKSMIMDFELGLVGIQLKSETVNTTVRFVRTRN